MRLQKGFSLAMMLALSLGLGAILVIVVAYFFIDKARDNPFDDNMVTLNALQQLDAKWSEHILTTQRYTLQDFDQLAKDVISIRQSLRFLELKGMSNEDIVGKATVKKYQIYKHSFATKNEAVENYKSQQAILRNSVRYLPEAGDIAQQILLKKKRSNKQSVMLLNESKLLINQYLLNIVAIKDVKEKLAKLDQTLQNTNVNAERKNKLQDYLTHSQLIIKHKPKVDATLERAMSVNIAKLSTDLVNQYAHSQEAVKKRIKQLQYSLLAGVAVLFLLLTWFLLKLRKSSEKIQRARIEKKAIQQQLLQSEEKVNALDKKIRRVIEQSASGQLSLSTFKQLKTSMPALSTHIDFLKNLKTNQALAQYEEKMDGLIFDIEDMYTNLHQLNILIDPRTNKDKQVGFDFNHVIQIAFDGVSNEVSESITFNKQLSPVPKLQASSIDLHQITTQLLHQSVTTWQEGGESIFVKTWATGHYANLCISILGYQTVEALYAEDELSDLKRLLEQNKAILKLTPRDNSKSAIIWVSFPYGI